MYVLLGLVSLGYMLSQKRPAPAAGTLDPQKRQAELPLHRRYQQEVTHDDVKTQEMMQAQKHERAARYPMQTGAVDPGARAYAGNALDAVNRSELAGVDFGPEEFKHNNMQPFFGSKQRASRPDADTGALLERFAGAPGVGNSAPKKEVGPLFAMEEAENVFGNRLTTQDVQNRFADLDSVNRVKNNELPFDQVRVGPGMGQGYGSEGVGGFGHNEDRDFAMARYKTVDELRPGNRPKVVSEGRANAGAVPGGSRGLIGQVSKNAPDTAFDIGEFGMVPTNGQAPAPTVRPDPVHDRKLRDPPSAFRVEGAGPAGYAAPGRTLDGEVSSKFGERKFRQETPPLTGAGRAGIGGPAARPGRAEDNERTLSQSRWQSASTLNARSAYPAGDVRAHVYGGIRASNRVHTSDASASHAFGNMAPQAPARGPAYDPVNHRPRTTLKEATMAGHQPVNYRNEQGQVAGEGASTRRTVREGFDDTYDVYAGRNAHPPMVQEGVGAPTADPREHDLPATTKELTERNLYAGNVVAGSGGAYGVTALGREEARMTNRQFTDQLEYYGPGGRPDKTAYAAHDNLLRSMTVSSNRGAPSEHFCGGKRFTEKGVDYQSMRAATVDGSKQDMLESRLPGGHGGAKQPPSASLQGDVFYREGASVSDYLANPNMPSCRGDIGSVAVQRNTGLSHDDRIDDQLLAWLHTNPLVSTPVSGMHAPARA